jgi:CRISPR-associated endonuclease Csn1
MPTSPNREVVLAFDLGKGSIGEAVRYRNEFIHVASWLIPQDLAARGPATKAGTPASRYRAWRTRVAHRAREEALRKVCVASGIEVLSAKRVARDPANRKNWVIVSAADPRLTREFPEPGDDTCYNSALLRIQLLRGVSQAGWQVFKALHSAIQRRGYDASVPWKHKAARETEAQEDGETQQRADAYLNALRQMAPNQPECQLPCYLDAHRLGLWDANRPDEYTLRINHRASPARNRELPDNPPIVAPRELVIAETRALLTAAAKLFPKLAGREDEILFGRGGRPYGSYHDDIRRNQGLRLGGANDWDGILGQKVPRFDNRIIAKCALIPRLNVCKYTPRRDVKGSIIVDSLLAAEVTFLLKLKNIRVQRPDKSIGGLKAEEIRSLFSAADRPPEKLGYTKKQWQTKIAAFGCQPAGGHELIADPHCGGRSRFCRPALQILKALILSGEHPATAHARELATRVHGNTDPRRGLIASDLDFLSPARMGETWDGLHVADQQHSALLRLAAEKGPDAAIGALIGKINNPIVRHRLEAFRGRLQAIEADLKKRIGRGPDEIVIEFVRTDFMGPKAKLELAKFQSERTKAREEARAQADKLGAEGRASPLKYELWKAQGGICLFTGDCLAATDLETLEIEHIVPRAKGGPDAVINYVVTTKATNVLKADRTPYAWFEAAGFKGWDAYVKRIESCATALRPKKVRLLTSPDAVELAERYTALAETAYIARLAQTVAALHFGWPINSQPGERRITIVNGGLTARVRRNYRLNSLLNPCPPGQDPKEWEENADVEKNRKDDRHHALDAMVISFLPAWTRDPKKEKFFRLPEGVTPATFETELKRVLPRQLHYERAQLEATAFGRRNLNGSNYGVGRVGFLNLVVKVALNGARSLNVKPEGSGEADMIVDQAIRRDVQAFIDQRRKTLTLEEWDRWAAEYRRGGPDGPKVNKVLVTITNPDALDEYADLAKDGSGQLRRGKRHRGYWVLRIPRPTKKDPGKTGLEVRPVYAHADKHALRGRLLENHGTEILLELESGCLVQIGSPIEHTKTPLPAGTYRLNSLWTQGNMVVSSQSGQTSAPIGLAKFIDAGLRRVK